jgi:hypothetical protein
LLFLAIFGFSVFDTRRQFAEDFNERPELRESSCIVALFAAQASHGLRQRPGLSEGF